MLKIVWLMCLIVPLSGCAGTLGLNSQRYKNQVQYALTLVKVDRPKETRERWGEVEKIDLAERDRYHYGDDLIESYFLAADDRVLFEIRNKTEHSIKLIWDEAAFMDLDGKSGKVMHEGVKYIDRNASQPPSVIPGNGSITDVVLPSNRVWYREGYYGTYYSSPGGWEHLPLILPQFEFVKRESGDTTRIVVSDSLRSAARGNIGKRIGVLLPLEIEGTVNEYTFWFEVMNFAEQPGEKRM